MKNLQHAVLVAIRRSRDGSFATRAERQQMLMSVALQLAVQFPGLQLKNLNPQHVHWLVQSLLTRRSERTGHLLSAGRQKNILSNVRWLLEQIGKANLLPSTNDKLGVQKRTYVAEFSKAITVDPALFDELDRHSKFVAASLRLTAAFGLRVEESLKIQPLQADCGDELRLKASWTKGGVPRSLRIRTVLQREALNHAIEVSQGASLIPTGMLYVEHRRIARDLLNSFGIHRVHGLRHAYAQGRYHELTGWQCPLCGGPTADQMSDAQHRADRAARLTISNEMGHGRASVTSVYLGSSVSRAESKSTPPEHYLDAA